MPIHVLLIEDNPGDARLILEMLKEAGDKAFSVECAESLSIAFDKLSKLVADVVILDLSLPDSHGLDTLFHFQSKFPHLPTVILTGHDDEEAAVESARAGAQDYLLKGTISGVFLSRTLKYAMERKKAERALRDSQRQLLVRERLAQIFLTVPDEQMYSEVLKAVLDATDGTQGLFGYIEDDGAIVYPSMTLVWDRCQVDRKTARYPRETWAGIWGRSMIEKQAMYSNQPGHVPEGNAPIRRALTVPVLYKDELIGQFTVANRATDYTDRDKEFLEGIAEYIAPVLAARIQRDRQEAGRTRAEEELRKLNQGLEERVRRRTTDLVIANKELEAFNYAVAHDLRGPLRHIHGFAEILAEEAGPALDDSARRHLQTIQDSVQHMSCLLEDLLSLARLGRQELRKQACGLNALVSEVVATLQPEIKDRAVEWRIASLPSVDCDPILMNQVLINLLSNALKFTVTRHPAVIEIGQTTVDGEPVIFVRDNGVGFNMKFADKLFGLFQRLHSQEDFTGTGVGLAIVHRIVQRHGGRVWAEAKLNKGATFYLDLHSSKSEKEQTVAHTAI